MRSTFGKAIKPSLPLPGERIFPPYKISAIVDVLEEQGIAPEAALRGSGLSVDDLANAFSLTSVSQYLTVCENAMSLSRDPALAFEVGARLHLFAYGIYGYALMSCMSIREYFHLVIKYRRLTTPFIKIELVEHPDCIVWRFPEVFVANPPFELRRFLIEQQFSVGRTHLREVAGQDHPPLRACFPYPAPPHADIYPKYLGCPCHFDQPQCELVYDNAMLDQKPQMAHRLTATLIQEMCDKLIAQTAAPAPAPAGLSARIYRILVDRTGELPSMDDVARTLGMSNRTLRRRLEMEDSSFQTILDDVRQSIALEYLRTTDMSTIDIAMRLGFSDAANFRRALKRWTGKGAKALRQ